MKFRASVATLVFAGLLGAGVFTSGFVASASAAGPNHVCKLGVYYQGVQSPSPYAVCRCPPFSVAKGRATFSWTCVRTFSKGVALRSHLPGAGKTTPTETPDHAARH
jgi:hypothetical protein